jgi:hypothetical protein
MTTDTRQVTELVGTAPEILDPGVWDAQLARVEARDTKYGERLRWVFTVPAAGQDGEDTETSVWSGFKTHKGTKAGDIIEALGGNRPGKDERLVLTRLVGAWCRLVVVPGDDDDFTKVENILPTQRTATGQPVAQAAVLDQEYIAWKAQQAAEREKHAQTGRPASEAERTTLDAGAPLPTEPVAD